MTPPRVVVVTRPTAWDEVLARYGTEGQAAFVLGGRGEDLDALRRDHELHRAALRTVLAAIPLAWRRARADRAELDRFLFAPDDVVVVVGQDGLVANVARFLAGQPVIGVDDRPGRNAHVLVRHGAEAGAALIQAAGEGRLAQVESRTLCEVRLADGQRLLGLNEVFLGHRTHQSARYRLTAREATERQSSSGVIVSTGTGSTGWAASVRRRRKTRVSLPAAEERRLAWFVREAWPGPGLGCGLVDGSLGDGEELVLVSEMDQGGVVFSDGLEGDALAFDRGRTARLGIAPERLNLAVA